jgi:hypothetical protein
MKPPVGHSVKILVREAAYGTVVGLIGAFTWYFSVTKPVQDKITNYYANKK